MIIITNGKEKFTVKKQDLQIEEKGVRISPNINYWYIDILLEGKDGYYSKIIKKFPPESGDVLKCYDNIDISKKNKILLTDNDYEEVKRLYDNMIEVRKHREKEVVELSSRLFAYEYYMNYCMQEINHVPIDEIFNYVVRAMSDYEDLLCYKDKIFKKTQDILRKNYNVKDLERFKE